MQILMVWDDCSYINGEWTDQAVKSFWISVKYNEIEKIIPLSSFPQTLKEEIDLHADSRSEIYILVSEDLQSVISMPAFYPYSGQWNGHSPFREIEPVEISSLEELPELSHSL